MQLLSRSFIPSAKVALAVSTALLLVGSVKAQFSVDTSSRETSRVFYNAVYPASESPASGWNGNVANANPGGTTGAFKSSVLMRVNFFRALAGIPGQVTESPALSAPAQSAALMMSANAALDHNPPASWKAYSADGALAAGKSNLAYGYSGSTAISEYMEESGSINQSVGHRRWLLYPQTQQMGTGDIPANGSYAATNALWIFDAAHYSDARPSVRSTFVAWPPAGYVPYQFVYPRWSFSYPGADFTNASVSMQRNGVGVAVRIDGLAQGYGENTVTFIPDNLDPNNWNGPTRPNSDLTTTVNVSNVVINGVAQSFSYNVTSFDPAQPGYDTPSFVINGADTPAKETPNQYSVAPQVLAYGYQWKYSQKQPYTVIDGAESAGTAAPSGFIVRDRKNRATGAFSYHFANPKFTRSTLVLNTPILCSPSTVLNFFSRLTYATPAQSAKVEISTDGGSQWQTLWSQKGNNRAGEKKFIKRAVSLAAFAGREVKVRFNYDLTPGSVFTQTSNGVGWYVDNISFNGAEKLVGTVIGGVSGDPSFTIVPPAGASYALQVRPLILGQFFLDWSPVKTVRASN